MDLSIWGNEALGSFNNGAPVEFILRDSSLPEKGNRIELNFFNSNGRIAQVEGVVEHVEPGLIRITKSVN